MDNKWSADLATLLRINKIQKISISTKGSDNTSAVYLSALVSHFAQNAVTIKRGGKYYNLTFPLKFVPYDEKNLFSCQQTEDFSKSPFLHVFFISAASVDEYRTSVRHNVSEWFATLSNRSDAQWLILVDSTRAKEKKNRTQFMDRLKGDFSKHHHKLVEVSESVEHGSFSVLVQAIQLALVAHYEILVDAWEKHLKSLKDEKNTPTWNFYRYVNEHLEHARFYWSLGALEHALKLYDELDAFFYNIVLTSSRNAPWLERLSCPLPACPTLSSSMPVHSVDEDHRSFIGVRHVLLSQQLLLTLCIYQQRLRVPNGVPPSIRVDFAAIILKYAYHCLQAVSEHGALHEILPCPYRLSIWTLFLVGEVFSLCGLLAEPGSVDGATYAACQLHVARFEALLRLSELSGNDKEEDRRSILKWLGKIDPILSEALQSESQMFQQVQRAHDTAAAFLTQSSRSRTSSMIGVKFANYLNELGRSEQSLPYELRFAMGLLEGGGEGGLAVKAINSVLSRMDVETDAVRLLIMRLFLALYSDSLRQRVLEGEALIKLLKEHSGAMMGTLPSLSAPFSLRLCPIRMPVLVPGDSLTLTVWLSSEVPVELPDCRLRIVLSHISSALLDRIKQPAFEIGYNKAERKSLMTCVHPDREERKQSEKPVEPREIVFTHNEAVLTVSPGINELEVVGTATERGFYVLDRVELRAVSDAVLFLLSETSIQTTDCPLAVIVQKTPNKLDVQMPQVLVSGVAQRLTIALEAGARQATSNLSVYAKENPQLEFMDIDGQWKPSVEVMVPNLEKGDRHPVEVNICRTLDGTTVSELKEFVEKIFIEWQGQIWPVDLTFSPLFTLQSTTTQLEAQCLLETEIVRSDSSEWTLLLSEATVEFSDSPQELSEGEESDYGTREGDMELAKSLNGELPDVPPSSVVGLVWMLGAGSDNVLRCRLRLRYTVVPLSGSDVSFVHRDYTFEDQLQVNAPKVEYELCAQMLSQQPGAQLCRAGTPCHMVISIRSLTFRMESLYVALDADEKMWNLQERAKVVQMKESGLGQIAFTVVPEKAGFLPFPQVSVFSAQASQLRSGDGFWSDAVEYTTGSCLVSFQRTAGKQIRVLGGIGDRFGDKEREHKGGIRGKLGKLFD